MSNFWNKDGLVVDVIKTSNGIKYITEDDVKSGVGHAVGEQWISFDGIIPEGGLPFDGQLRNIELYQQLFDWAKENGRVISETEWQQLRETNNDNVPYYSSGDGSMGKKASGSFTTYRLYSLVKFVVNGVDFAVSFSEDTIVSELERLNNLSDFPVIIEYVPIMGVLDSPEEDETEEWSFNIIAKEEGTIGNSYTFQYVADDDTSYNVFLSGGQDEVESTTFRLPIFNSYFKADVVGGGYIAEGLPNITGTVGAISGAASVGVNTGAFAHGGTTSVNITNGGENDYKASFDASRCSAIYGNSEHVTPETSTVIVGVWAVGSYTNVTNIDMSDIKEAINVASTYDSMPLLSHYWDYEGMGNAGWVRADGYWLSGDLYTDAYNKLEELDGQIDTITILRGTYTSSKDFTAPYNFLIDYNTRTFRLPIFSQSEKYLIESYTDTYGNKCSLFSDGSVKIEGQHNTTTTSATVNWTTPVNTDYKLTLTETCKTNTSTDTEGFTAYAAPSNYTSNSFRLTTYKDTSRYIEWKLEGTPLSYQSWYMSSCFYFKLGNTFINEGEMNAPEISDKIDRVWESWQEADYVVDSYSNGTEWYRLYKSGWLEQGGEVYHNVKETHTVNLLLPYRDTYYNVTKTVGVDGVYTDTASIQWVTIFNYTTTTFDTKSSNVVGLNKFRWKACGYSDNLN